MKDQPSPLDWPDVASAICDAGRLAWQRGFVAAWDGNISARVADDCILCTPTRHSKGFLSPEDLCVVNLAGEQIGGTRPATSEIRMHLVLYNHAGKADRAGAAIHLHPIHATALAVCHVAPPRGQLAETELYLGDVPVIPYRQTGTQEFAEALVPYLPGRVAFLLANHGAVTIGRDVAEAWAHMEILEQACQVAIVAGLPREPSLLGDAELEGLGNLRAGLRSKY